MHVCHPSLLGPRRNHIHTHSPNAVETVFHHICGGGGIGNPMKVLCIKANVSHTYEEKAAAFILFVVT